MVTIEDVRVTLFALAFVVVCFSLIAYAWRNPTGAAKLLCLIAVVALGLIGIASAETNEIEYFVVEEIVGVTAENFNGEVVYRIDFVFHDDVLSWYEDEPIYAGRTYVLKIWRSQEVVNSAWL